jgi:Asp-tRNA(Asn)/Glu-tRNA(Gln) amidotransferase A subunit family amidase|tara:strand:- start:25 stop:369 length:345 start_codon:yes stop_codon:yes gene_type:complete
MNQMQEYTQIWDLLGFPCGVLPITRVRNEEQFFKDHYNDSWTKQLAISAEDSENMPIGLQVIGYACEDEKVLGIMQMIESELRFKVEVPTHLVEPLEDAVSVKQLVRNSLRFSE